jgi:glycosyltransferase involved in cell wall biosynthesis
MRICFINPMGEYYSPVSGGAIATIAMEAGRELIERGHCVAVATQLNGDEQYKVGEVIPLILPDRKELSLFRRSVSALRRRVGRWTIPGYEYYRNAVTEAVAKWKPDAVILFNDLISPAPIRKALPNARIAVWLQNEWRTHQRHIRATRAATNRFLACSEYIRHWTAVEHDIPIHEIRTVPSGVNLETFSPAPQPKPKDGPLRVLFIGRIDPNKGPDVVSDAVGELQKEGKAVQLTVAGGLWWYGHGREMDSPYFRCLKSKMDAAHATYLGHVARPCVPDLLRQHDVVCVLSRSNEPFALVTLEAMACGCAVVSSGRGGLLESCGGAALLADPDNLGSVVTVLRSLAANPALLQRRKAAALKRAARASWSETARILERELSLE